MRNKSLVGGDAATPEHEISQLTREAASWSDKVADLEKQLLDANGTTTSANAKVDRVLTQLVLGEASQADLQKAQTAANDARENAASIGILLGKARQISAQAHEKLNYARNQAEAAGRSDLARRYSEQLAKLVISRCQDAIEVDELLAIEREALVFWPDRRNMPGVFSAAPGRYLAVYPSCDIGLFQAARDVARLLEGQVPEAVGRVILAYEKHQAQERGDAMRRNASIAAGSETQQEMERRADEEMIAEVLRYRGDGPAKRITRDQADVLAAERLERARH